MKTYTITQPTGKYTIKSVYGGFKVLFNGERITRSNLTGSIEAAKAICELHHSREIALSSKGVSEVAP